MQNCIYKKQRGEGTSQDHTAGKCQSWHLNQSVVCHRDVQALGAGQWPVPSTEEEPGHAPGESAEAHGVRVAEV